MLNKKRKITAIVICISLMMSLMLFFFCLPSPKMDIKEKTFSRLEKIRKKKKKRIIDFFEKVQERASDSKNDDSMLRFFTDILHNPDNEALELEFDRYYVEKYSDFYDILFIDSSGYIFHSVRKESDYHTNIFNGRLSKSNLARRLSRSSTDDFIEYEYYSPSDEPAAFFTTLLKNGDERLGWFVFQCPINHINTILTDRKHLDRTGEVYLVNHDRLMLSESRFIEDSTILKLTVDTRAVKDALLNKSGEIIMKDYRNIVVFSSYEQFEVFGTRWIIITEIDENEVISDHYQNHEKFFLSEVCNYLENRQRKIFAPLALSDAPKRIDMNEFSKADGGTLLQTHGISTCTGIVIQFPQKFSYLAHISPTDDIYRLNAITKWILGDNSSDFLGEIINRITYYDVYSYELKNLQISIILTHKRSLGKVVEKILDNGLDLSNITLMYNPKALNANILVSTAENSVDVEWQQTNRNFVEKASDVENLGDIVKYIMQYNSL